MGFAEIEVGRMVESGRGAGRARAGLLACAIALTGCAHRLQEYDLWAPLKPVLDPYSRNPIVCIPTAVGNIIGGAPGIPLWALSGGLLRPLIDLPAFAVGGVVGLPFIPLSYLRPEDPCDITNPLYIS